MKRILSTTAVIVALSGAAYADAHTGKMGMVEFEQSDFFASDLIGMRIYNAENGAPEGDTMTAGAEQEWDDIGEINDIIIGDNGEVRAVILGVGGFLGMGERDVSVSMEDIRILNDEDGDRFLVVSTSQEALEAAPEFDREMDGDMAQDNANATANDETVTVTGDATPMADTGTAVEGEMQEAEAELEEAGNEAEAAMEEAEAEVETEMNEAEAEVESEMESDNVTVVTTETDNANADVVTTETDNADADVVVANDDAERVDPVANDNMLTRPTYEREGYMDAEVADREQLTAEIINGAYVYGANDETVGEIDDILMSEDGKATDVVINVGGFLGLGEKPVLVNFDQIQVLKNEAGDDYRFYIDSTEEKLEALPEYQQ